MKIGVNCDRARFSFSTLQNLLRGTRVFALEKRNQKIFSLLLYLLPFTSYVSPAIALTEKLGVVRSQENAKQWREITDRLQTVGVNYCIVDASDWQQEADLSNVKVLFLPNVETLNRAQAIALARWIGSGGRVIVTGPTGNLSQPEVRSQLRSLFGAYWGFPIAGPSKLKPLQVEEQEWLPQSGLSGTAIGGAVIPAGINSQTAAVWRSGSTHSAVVVTDQSTFLGWRWGTDAFSSTALDTAWLKAALSRYGIERYRQFPAAGDSKPAPCNSEGPIANQRGLRLPDRRRERALFPLRPRVVPAISPAEVTAMSQELEGLIARFESTLLAADATNSGIDLPTEEAIEKFLDALDKGGNSQEDYLQASRQRISNRSARRAVIDAREKLQNFLQLVDQRKYDQARQQWMQARRTLWNNYPTDRQLAQPEIRAMWLDRGTIVKAKSESDLAEIFDRMAAGGINTVFFETVNASYPIYPSRVAPEQNPLVRGWDPLRAAVKLAHQRGMELHAWAWIFAAANQRHNQILNQPVDYLGPVLSIRPDWGITDKKGNLFDYSSGYKKAFFDPANPRVQNYLLSLLEEIATNYDVDGIQLDYIRYPFQDPRVNQTFGYGKSSRWLFKQMTGIDPIEMKPNHPLWSHWTGFRSRQVDNFVLAASERLKEKRPDLILSAAVFPMPREERLFRLQQHWEKWVQNEWVDIIVLMTYALDTDNLEEKTQPLFSQSMEGSALLLPGIRLLNVPDPVTVDQVQLLRDLPAGGYALFAAENFTSNLQRIFSRTQGSGDSADREPLPHRQPFQVAFARYQALQREWSFLLTKNQLSMEKAVMKDWGRQADFLAEALKQLADEPSNKRLLSAQIALSSFRRQFGNWMVQQRKAQPYQVQAWENRLETLERLLSYGERKVLNRNRAEVATQNDRQNTPGRNNGNN